MSQDVSSQSEVRKQQQQQQQQQQQLLTPGSGPNNQSEV
jgi:hypothetical protein